MVAMTLRHALSMTTPDDPAYENKPSNWNADHLYTFALGTTDIMRIFAGTNSQSTGDLKFANSNGVSFGLDTNGTLTASVRTDYAGSGFTSTTVAGAAPAATLDANGLSFAMPNYLTTAALSGDSSKYAGLNFATTSSNGSRIAGTLNTSGLTLGVPFFLTNNVISAGTTNQAISNWSFSDGSGVSFGLNVRTITAAVRTNYAASGQTTTTQAGATLGVTLDTNGLSLALPLWITTAALSGDSTKYAGINGAATGADITLNTSGLSFNITGRLGLGFTTTTQAGTGVNATLNSVGFSVAYPLWLTTADLSQNSSLYAGLGFTSTTTAGTAVKGTQNTAGLSLAFPIFVTNALTTAALSQDSSKYAGTNFAGTNVSGTLNTSGLSLSVAAPGGATPISFFENMPGMQNTTAMTFNAASISHVVAFQLPQPGSFSYLRIPVRFTSASLANYSGSNSASSGGAFSYSTWNAVAYSLGTGASSQSLISVASGSAGATFGISYSFSSGNSAWSITQSYTAFAYGSAVGLSTQFSTTSASVGLSVSAFSNFNQLRWLDINFANSLSAGPYWMIIGLSTSSTTSGTVGTAAISQLQWSYLSHFGVSQPNSWWNGQGDTGGSSGIAMGAGSFSTAGGGTTSILPIANISSFASNNRMYFQLVRSA